MLDTFLEQIQKKRHELKMTQSELARRAAISLATLQNIEAGRANPSYQTLKSLLSALGCELDVRENQIDWQGLCAAGLPLMDHAQTQQIQPHRDYLKRQLLVLSQHVAQIQSKTREHSAFYALLVAIRDHYPRFWGECPAELEKWLNIQKKAPSPKLRRIALHNISSYL